MHREPRDMVRERERERLSECGPLAGVGESYCSWRGVRVSGFGGSHLGIKTSRRLFFQ